MSLSFGQNEPQSCPKNALLGGVISDYFVSFFLKHPVRYNENQAQSALSAVLRYSISMKILQRFWFCKESIMAWEPPSIVHYTQQ